MLFQYLSGFEPILYTTHTNEEPKRFLKDPYRSEDTEWIRNLAATKGFSIKEKLAALSKLL